MKRDRVRAVVDKELADLWHHRFIVYTMVSVPIILALTTIGSIVATAYLPSSTLDPDLVAYLPAELAGLPQTVALSVLMNDQFLFYYLLIPAMLPIVIATTSIIGEKELKSLEPLLATPISTSELLLGKTLAAAAIPVVATWTTYAVTAVVAWFVAPPLTAAFLVRPAWVLAMMLLSPLLAVLAVLVGVVISSRVNDIRVAQQLGGLFVLPVVGGSVGALLGKLFLSVVHVVLTATWLVFLVLAGFAVAVELFERESILTRWK